MWDFITMVPTFFGLYNAVDWGAIWAAVTTICTVLFVASERLATNDKIAANSVFQLVQNTLKKYKKD